MQGRKLLLASSAYDDLDRITDYLIERNAEAAFALYERIMSAMSRLKEFPQMGRLMEDAELKSQVHHRLVVDDYAVIYRVLDEYVFVEHVFNTKQDYARCFSSWK